MMEKRSPFLPKIVEPDPLFPPEGIGLEEWFLTLPVPCLGKSTATESMPQARRSQRAESLFAEDSRES